MRDEIVAELQGRSGVERDDIAYRSAQFFHHAGGWSQQLAATGYAMRQPLNPGVNSIRYLQYFSKLRFELLVGRDNPSLEKFYSLYVVLSTKTRPSDFLHKLFDASLLLYASQFGTAKLYEASLWLFRVVASPRLTNETTVRESTVQAFEKKEMVLDHIVASYSHDELLTYLQEFKYSVDPTSLKGNSVKARFVNSVKIQFELDLPEEPKSVPVATTQLLSRPSAKCPKALTGTRRSQNDSHRHHLFAIGRQNDRSLCDLRNPKLPTSLRMARRRCRPAA